jgi:hypothetical protein
MRELLGQPSGLAIARRLAVMCGAAEGKAEPFRTALRQSREEITRVMAMRSEPRSGSDRVIFNYFFGIAQNVFLIRLSMGS